MDIKTEDVPISDRQNEDKIVGPDASEESQSKVSVSKFGMNMLVQMGWYEGRGIGKNTDSALFKVVEFKPRLHRLGLGANKGKGESENITDQAEKKKRKEVFSQVKIITGKHQGLEGIIIKKQDSTNECLVQLYLSEENVKVKLSEIELINDDSEQPDNKENTEKTKKKAEKKEKQSKSAEKLQSKHSKSKSRERHKKPLQWIIPNIRIKIISKNFSNGRYYNTKAAVLDILDKQTFTVITQKGDVIDSLREKDVESALPVLEGKVVFVKGKYKNEIGVLKERDKKRNWALVQISETQEIVQCTQDDICEFLGG